MSWGWGFAGAEEYFGPVSQRCGGGMGRTVRVASGRAKKRAYEIPDFPPWTPVAFQAQRDHDFV